MKTKAFSYFSALLGLVVAQSGVGRPATKELTVGVQRRDVPNKTEITRAGSKHPLVRTRHAPSVLERWIDVSGQAVTFKGKRIASTIRDRTRYALVTSNGIEFDGRKPWAYQHPTSKRQYERFELRSGDVSWADLGKDPEPERTMLQSGWYAALPDRTMLQSKGSFLIEPGPRLAAVPGFFSVLMQWHVRFSSPPTWSYSPPIGLGLSPDDELTLDIRFSTQSKSSIEYPTYPGVIWVSDKPIKRGRWHSFVWRIRFDETGTAGRVQLWIDGEHVVNYAGPVGYKGNNGYSYDRGIYRKATPETIAVRYANVTYPAAISDCAPLSNSERRYGASVTEACTTIDR